MAFTFHQASCVVVGTFNIYIIRPDWLGEIGLLKPETPIKIESQLNQPGFRLSSPRLGSNWLVLPNKLVLETDKPNENCGSTADTILEFLPWTPLIAIGLNFVYRGDRSAITDGDQKAFPPGTAPNGYEMNQRTWHLGIRQDEQTFNLQLSEFEDKVELRANVHTDLQDKKVEFARGVARRFFDVRSIAESLLSDSFNARIDNADQ